jgi:hypothetical protein
MQAYVTEHKNYETTKSFTAVVHSDISLVVILDCRASELLSTILHDIHDHIRPGDIAANLVDSISQRQKGKAW